MSDCHPEWARRRLLDEGTPTALRDGVWKDEVAFLHRDGHEIPISMVLLAHRGPDGEVEFFSSISRDISERIQLQDQLLHAQKMEAVGRLAGGVAHDFNNLLVAILGYAQIVHARLAPDDPSRGHLQQISIAGERAANLTRQLLAFSGQQVSEPRPLDLNDLILDLDRMLRRIISEDIELVVLPAEGLGTVRADPGQMEQVLVNLVVNARDAMPQGGHLVIETANVTLRDEEVRHYPDARAGEHVMVAVADAGIGIPEDVRESIFEPFFTTKKVGKGTGLGLSPCYGIVAQSGGHIVVDSELGRGTTFRVYLPRLEAQSVPLRQNAGDQSDQAPVGTETVLLVEDEPSVRAVAAEVLRGQGYKVLEATNGMDGLSLAQGHADEIHLLLTDVVMPLMGGTELAEHVTQPHPETAVLFMSGYADVPVVHRPSGFHPAQFMQKPFTLVGLARRVREVLDRRSSSPEDAEQHLT